MEKSISEYKELYQFLDYEFKDEALLEEAFTHKGFNHECHYERLEFLGDRVVNLVVAELLYTHFKNEAEGALAKRHAALVRKEALSGIAISFGMDKYIRLNKYDEVERQNPSLLCDICEAVFGAFYLDAGYEKVREVIKTNWHDMIEKYKTPPMDSKTKLQEWAQARKLPTPNYEVIGQEGQDHAPIFSVKVRVIGLSEKIGKGSSKREAEQNSAKAILDDLGVK